jgi:hypothetical protein
MNRRVSTGALIKLARVLQGGLVAARAASLDNWRHEPDRPALWTRF